MELSPDAGHSKYMYLGQIHTGQEAVDYYTRGVEVLLADLNKQMPVSFSALLTLSLDGEWNVNVTACHMCAARNCTMHKGVLLYNV